MIDTLLTVWYLIWLKYHAKKIGRYFGLSLDETLDALEKERRRLGRQAKR
jgi:hypothetical protein